jgi:hypothetical protein
MIDLDEYEKLLENHDWSYEYTEDRKKWAAGNLSYQELIKYSTDSKAHAELFFKYKNKYGTKN